ncbi:MAG: phosphodiesterase [Clostridiales bacterium]|nr:phosphodiesterase [Clostridiales bacterium]
MQKCIIASDIHGSAYWCKQLLAALKEENAEKLVLLGDILYHGPRNDFPDDYSPKQVFAMLNEIKNKIVCVRGNCDSEVDQMVLEFPILADYALMTAKDKTLFLTHGHLYNRENPPLLQKGDILFNGHFHTPECTKTEQGFVYMNCGSVSLPKPDTPHSYILYDDGTLYFKDLETGGIFDCYTL